MELFLTILKIIGIILLVILALALLILLVPVFYEAEVNTTSKATAYDVKIKTILNIIIITFYNGLTELRIFGFIKIKLKSHDKKENNLLDEDEKEETPYYDKVPEDASILRKLKLKAYIIERRIKEKTYKFRNTIKQVNEYKYKMELLKKTIEFVEKILKSLKPKKSYIAVTFGTGNSELTGKLMAMAAPWLGKHPKLTVIPDFTKSCLDFDVYAKGTIMPVRLLVIAIKYWNEDAVKNLRALKKGAKHE